MPVRVGYPPIQQMGGVGDPRPHHISFPHCPSWQCLSVCWMQKGKQHEIAPVSNVQYLSVLVEYSPPYTLTQDQQTVKEESVCENKQKCLVFCKWTWTVNIYLNVALQIHCRSTLLTVFTPAKGQLMFCWFFYITLREQYISSQCECVRWLGLYCLYNQIQLCIRAWY